MILSSGVYGANGRPGANSRIVTGHLGVGGMGSKHVQDITSHIGAICDVDAEHAKSTAQKVNRDVPVYSDYRQVLDRKDIDAVLIAAPDHWHALMAIHACEAGKDVYVEKPACKFIGEGRAMVDAMKQHNRVVQVGSQGRCHPAANALRQFIQKGSIGRVTHIECWHNDNHVGGDITKTSAPPPHLDWDMWLGPLQPWAYNPDYCHRNFRWMFDIGGGQIRDRGPHVFNLVSWIMGLDRTGPSRVTAKGQQPLEGMYDCPVNFEITYEFEDPELTIHWAQPGIPAGDFEFGAVYHGTRGKTVVRGGDGRVFPDEQVIEFAKANRIDHELQRGVRTHMINQQNWLECIQSREQPIMDMESGHRIATMCILANMSYRLGRTLKWNARRERVENDEGANLLLGSPGRGEFRLPERSYL